jgi:hypothetical protein
MGVQAVGEAVALKPFRAILLGNDVGLLSGVKESPQAEGMVYMPVGVDSGMQWCWAPGPDSIVDGLSVLGEARVDKEQTSFGSQRVSIDERPMQQEV